MDDERIAQLRNMFPGKPDNELQGLYLAGATQEKPQVRELDLVYCVLKESSVSPGASGIYSWCGRTIWREDCFLTGYAIYQLQKPPDKANQICANCCSKLAELLLKNSHGRSRHG